MSNSDRKKILFKMTGSIAAYKACSVISRLVQQGYDVQVVASSSALQFVGMATLEGLTGKRVLTDTFESGSMMAHIHLMRWADLILVAPASAHFINRIAQGVGDDLLSTLFLAHRFDKPYLLAPAMNTSMYMHPMTQSSLKKLRETGVQILETASGVLACGEVGWGRLLEPELIFEEVLMFLGKEKSTDLASTGVRTKSPLPQVLVTSGGTIEPIDGVRFIANHSTGKTGAVIAETLADFGYQVTYLCAEGAVRPVGDIETYTFQTFQDLQIQLKSLLSEKKYLAVIHAAAVSDFSLKEVQTSAGHAPVLTGGKMTSDADLILNLKSNPKLIDQVKTWSKDPIKLVGFKMTANANAEERKSAVLKVSRSSHADLIISNDLTEMTESRHSFAVYKDGKKILDLHKKQELGQYLAEWLMSAEDKK